MTEEQWDAPERHPWIRWGLGVILALSVAVGIGVAVWMAGRAKWRCATPTLVAAKLSSLTIVTKQDGETFTVDVTPTREITNQIIYLRLTQVIENGRGGRKKIGRNVAVEWDGQRLRPSEFPKPRPKSREVVRTKNSTLFLYWGAAVNGERSLTQTADVFVFSPDGTYLDRQSVSLRVDFHPFNAADPADPVVE